MSQKGLVRHQLLEFLQGCWKVQNATQDDQQRFGQAGSVHESLLTRIPKDIGILE